MSRFQYSIMVDKSKIRWETLNGFKILRIKDHPIMSTGVWNQWYYDEANLREAFRNTDWDDPAVNYLFFDHEDSRAQAWIGKIENPRLVGNKIVADLLIANEDAQKAILMGAKFGISPKIYGKGENNSVKDFIFKNFSLVVEPACKMTYLNAQQNVEEGIRLIPNTFFKLRSGEIMEVEKDFENEEEEEKKEENVAQEEEQTSESTTSESTEAKEESEQNMAEKSKQLKKKKYPYPEEEQEKLKKKKYPYPEEQSEKDIPQVKVVGDIQTSSSDVEVSMSALKITKLFDSLEKMGVLNSEYTQFVKEYKKKYPKASFKEIAKAWKSRKKNSEIEKKLSSIEKKLTQLEKGNKLSVKSEQTAPVTDDVDAGMLQFLKQRYLENLGDVVLTLSYQPQTNAFGWRVFELSSTVTSTTSTRGTQFSTAPYYLQPILYVRKAIDAAKERMRFMQVSSQFTLPEGHKDMIIPYRTKYLADSSWETSSAEYSAGNEISWTAINTMDGVKASPTRYNYGVALTNEAIRTNAINLVAYCREELSYKYENSIDSAIRNQLLGTVGASPTLGATEMSDTANGCQTIYGGDATDADNSIDSGDVLTTDLIAKARRLLMSTAGYFWQTNVFTKSSTTKNPWEPTANEPFVLFIAPEQEEALLKESQFINAAEYGSNEVVLNGEIGRYLGVKVVSTTKVPAISSGDNIKVQGASQSFDTASHLCGMIKAGVAGALVWGVKPEIRVFDWPNADQIRMKLTMSYAAVAVHSDAIVRIVVSDA